MVLSPVHTHLGMGLFHLGEVLQEEAARAQVRVQQLPCQGEGWAPLPAGSPLLPGVLCCQVFLLSEPCECVCLLKSKFKNKTKKYLNIL